MTTSNKQAEIVSMLHRMTVPPFKMDVSKPQVVKWLIENLKTRNAAHAHYIRCMRLLLLVAVEMNSMKKSEVSKVEAALVALENPPEPDAHCMTTCDGGCVSVDARCMHNKGASEVQVSTQIVVATKAPKVVFARTPNVGTIGHVNSNNARPLALRSAAAMAILNQAVMAAQNRS